MSRHSFDPEVAAALGLNAAVIYQNIVWWCEKNAANGKHLHEGRHWTYNSVKAFADLFPYMTADQIRRALQRLEEAGYIGVGNFNATPTDRTKWFCDLRQMHLASVPNGNGMDANSYKEPVSKPVGKPDGKPLGDFDAFWAEVPRKVGKDDARKAYAKALKKADHDTLIAGMRRYAQEREGQDEKFTVHPSRWLNAGRWEDVPAARPNDFHDKIDAMLKGQFDELPGPNAIDCRPRQPLLGGMEAPRASDERHGHEAPPFNRGGHQQEIARFVNPRKFG
jgi:hypothetical protein